MLSGIMWGYLRLENADRRDQEMIGHHDEHVGQSNQIPYSPRNFPKRGVGSDSKLYSVTSAEHCLAWQRRREKKNPTKKRRKNEKRAQKLGGKVRFLMEDLGIDLCQDSSIRPQSRRDVLAAEQKLDGALEQPFENVALDQVREAGVVSGR